MSFPGFRENSANTGYYINVGSLLGLIHSRTGETAGNTGVAGGQFSTATWAWSSLTDMSTASWNTFSTALATAGRTILKDMGRTIVSSSRTFRKIQLVRPAGQAPSTFGVGGSAAAGYPGESYFTGYIELGFGGEGTSTGSTYLPAPVAAYGR